MKGLPHQTIHALRQRSLAEAMLRRRTPRADVARALGLPVDVVSRIAAQIAPRPITAEDVQAARTELRTGARRCYLMAAQLREALGLPQRPSLMPPEEPEHGLCGYCGEPTATAYCGSTCAFYSSRLRSVEEGRLFRGAGAPVSSLVDQELRRADAGRAARLLAAGASWHLAAGELGLDHDDDHLRDMARSLAEAA